MSVFQEPSVVVAYAFDPSTWRDQISQVQGQPDLQRIQDNQGYEGKSSLKNNNKNKHCFKIVVFISATIQVYKVTGLFLAF